MVLHKSPVLGSEMAPLQQILTECLLVARYMVLGIQWQRRQTTSFALQEFLEHNATVWGSPTIETERVLRNRM